MRNRKINIQGIRHRNCGKYPWQTERNQRTIRRPERRRKKATTNSGCSTAKFSVRWSEISGTSPPGLFTDKKPIKKAICAETGHRTFLPTSTPIATPRQIIWANSDFYWRTKRKKWRRLVTIPNRRAHKWLSHKKYTENSHSPEHRWARNTSWKWELADRPELRSWTV